MQQHTLVLSIALNGYQWMYSKELASHKNYAQQHGYTYQAVTRPYLTPLGVECCWLKLTLIHNALLSGYEQVMFLDADTLVNPNCPALSTVLSAKKYIYMAKGYSGRFNSGVLIAKKHQDTLTWLEQVISARGQQVQQENEVGWGENGHIIELSKNVPFIFELNKKWNNTSEVELDDYIRHRNCGPLRTKFFSQLFHQVVFFFSAKFISLSHATPAQNILLNETNKILARYPKLTNS